jgi:pimeloyl-ACP methyl ester carboxylesterase
MFRFVWLFLIMSTMQVGVNAQYVCPPCHASCDQLEFKSPGTCDHCGMKLIAKQDQLATEEFFFNYNNVRYSAEIGLPKEPAKGTIVLIPGHGKTDFVGGGQYYQLKQFFTSLGFNTLSWDKKGCGKSEGEYEHHQSVQSSADESVAAIQEFKTKQIAGSDRIGLWGISRAGWICPLIPERYPNISFWISVSGTDQFDTFRYMIESNFALEGRTSAQVTILMNQFDNYHKTLRHGGQSYSQLVESSKELFSDPYYQSLGQKIISEKEFASSLEYYKNSKDMFDEKTGLFIMVPGFENVLSKINFPVLAILGELDSQVNWRSTKQLYENTLGKNPKSRLTVKSFPNCNHNINACKTGSSREDLKEFNWAPCEGYYETMRQWLVNLSVEK